ncbi:MAG: putative manganese-dependent inorganic diphosphatase [Lachnospiraceae bacterium]|nr:putative manganese-dependent inorganic diphosphatase [Lachnospiraceae bacterium]
MSANHVTPEGIEKIYIIGHKNPDTDSICSAICYAYLKHAIDGKTYIPMRAGEINAETEYVLKAFDAQVPTYVENVQTQVKDVEYRHMDGVSSDISIKDAWEILSNAHATTLPTIDENGKLEGIITVKDIAMTYMEVYDNRIIATANTPYSNIVNTLAAKLVIGEPSDVISHGKVLIAAANPDMMENYINKNDIVILGNRYESQLCAIEMDAQAIIICDGADVSKTITKLAEQKGCSIIVTPYDTYTVARLINQSIPIRYFMKKDNLITFSTEDYINDIRTVMAGKRHQYYPILNEWGNYVGLISQRNYLNANPKKVILVDHNEHSQTVDGIDEVTLLEIIDHHRIGGLQTMNPVYFRNQPLGCTATIIYQMFLENNISIPKNIAGLLASAIISDTLMFRSPTCTPVDEAACRSLAEIAGIDVEAYAISMFNAGSKLGNKSTEDIFNQDYKVFTTDGKTFGIGQITSFSNTTLNQIEPDILEYMKDTYQEKGVDMLFFMLTNIFSENTQLLFFGKDAAITVAKAFKQDLDLSTNVITLNNVVSRKKQVIPKLMNAMHK